MKRKRQKVKVIDEVEKGKDIIISINYEYYTNIKPYQIICVFHFQPLLVVVCYLTGIFTLLFNLPGFHFTLFTFHSGFIVQKQKNQYLHHET